MMLKGDVPVGVRVIKILSNVFMEEGRAPDNCLMRKTVNIFKSKGNALVSGNYRGVKLLDLL